MRYHPQLSRALAEVLTEVWAQQRTQPKSNKRSIGMRKFMNMGKSSNHTNSNTNNSLPIFCGGSCVRDSLNIGGYTVIQHLNYITGVSTVRCAAVLCASDNILINAFAEVNTTPPSAQADKNMLQFKWIPRNQIVFLASLSRLFVNLLHNYVFYYV